MISCWLSRHVVVYGHGQDGYLGNTVIAFLCVCFVGEMSDGFGEIQSVLWVLSDPPLNSWNYLVSKPVPAAAAGDKENLRNFNLIRDLSRGADPSVSYSSCTRVEMFAKSCNYAASSSSRVSSCISNSIPVSYVGDDLS